ncbi:MAG: DISARM system helicase DrmA [Bryobacteraceae bacterium]|nr:DISARM system helicase DrmA [Bryobacteraceae bacterium]
MTSADVRTELVNALRLDLVGPESAGLGDPNERLDQAPSRWYLTGFLVPTGAPPEQVNSPDDDDEEVEAAVEPGATDDDTPREKAAGRDRRLPSSAGLSVLLPPGAAKLGVRITWGDYKLKPPPQDEPEVKDKDIWTRTPRQESVTFNVSQPVLEPLEKLVPLSDGLYAALLVRPLDAAWTGNGLPAGTKSVSVFLVNKRPASSQDFLRDESFAFQVSLELSPDQPFLPRPDPRGMLTEEWDEDVADLQYRDTGEFAVGHNVSTETRLDEDGHCLLARTCWIPKSQVERVEPPQNLGNFELGMDRIAAIADPALMQAELQDLPAKYRTWIAAQQASIPSIDPAKRRATATNLMAYAGVAADRIERGILLLTRDSQALLAFRVANKAMADAARQRLNIPVPEWRPFQLAFLLMNLEGIADPASQDRNKVDLLFFPTGGGKTEAYLGLAAFTLILRRLRNPGISGAGTSVLMRYTLRLLTLDQLGRAATLICALELIREKDKEFHPDLKLGDWPFEIGLWVGKSATPNRMGSTKQGENQPDTARRRTKAFKAGDTDKPPLPLEKCPWCGAKFTASSFNLYPNETQPADLRVKCANYRCEFKGDARWLPIVAVDEPIYRRLPCFIIATVDKFAALPWLGRVGAFFGKVDRYDARGFYGPCDPKVGDFLPERRLPPPDLIIQDELHLISGPLGTIAGLYEAVVDALCEQEGRRPKIVASTATVRKADAQIRALFGRNEVEVFPPPGPDRRDSFFAETVPTSKTPARLYVGVAAPGRNVKSVLLRVYLAALCRSERFSKFPASDPYRTLVGYFNALRELGGARRLIEDEVRSRADAGGYETRKRVGEAQGLFDKRRIASPLELTSRVDTIEVSEAKRRLALDMSDKERVDVAIATNMISVGLDIGRLGLMVVFGQPKTTAEYIQATSRVGREKDKPGLVITILNPNKPRDRSHYERFTAWHQTFYRGVEATSVTPFAPRALDRALPAATVALARHGHPPMTRSGGADAIVPERKNLAFVAKWLSERARDHAKADPAVQEALRLKVWNTVASLLDAWEDVSVQQQKNAVRMKYWQYEGDESAWLLRDYLAEELKTLQPTSWKYRFRAKWSMRDVEPAVEISVRGPGAEELDEV